MRSTDEQISLFDWLESENPRPEVSALSVPDAQWWQWNSDNSMACHQQRVNGYISTIETVNPGGALHNMCRNGLELLSWVKAFDDYCRYRPLKYMDLLDLCVHGRNIRRYIKAQGVSPEAFAPYRSEDYIVRRITEAAVEEVYSIAFEDASIKIKEWAKEIGRPYDAQTVSAWFGIGGCCGPDCIELKHDGRGIEIDWDRSELGSIYPMQLTWDKVYRIMQNFEE